MNTLISIQLFRSCWRPCQQSAGLSFKEADERVLDIRGALAIYVTTWITPKTAQYRVVRERLKSLHRTLAKSLAHRERLCRLWHQIRFKMLKENGTMGALIYLYYIQ